MKWKARPKPQEGDRKTVRQFLWKPIRIDAHWRWLEFHTVHFECVHNKYLGCNYWGETARLMP